MTRPTTLNAFAVAAPGLEALVAGELAQLGVAGGTAVEGGVEFPVIVKDVYRANLHLRTASRVLIRLARFPVVSFSELERNARRVPWKQVIRRGDQVQLRVTCRKSKLYHSGAVAERLMRDIVERIGAQPVAPSKDPDADPGPAQLIVVRIERNQCTISADSSGEHLHRRGYRTAVTPAPLRETLAAAMLVASRWDRTSPLLDPFCGSGTIPIEAALMAANIAPGMDRAFRFMDWPGFDDAVWNDLRAQAKREERRNAVPVIVGSDRSEAALRAAAANASRAGVAELVRLERADALDLSASSIATAWVVTNPPYGVRLGERSEARAAAGAFLSAVAAEHPGWQLSVLVPAGNGGGPRGLALRPVLQTRNGGLEVTLLSTATDSGATAAL